MLRYSTHVALSAVAALLVNSWRTPVLNGLLDRYAHDTS
jgi:hypothetical protein